MNQYYVTWFTWHMAQLQTPWDFWYLQKGKRYKPLNDQVPAWDPDQAQRMYANGDAAGISKLEQDYISDVKLMCFLMAWDESHAQAQVREIFPDAEFDKICLVDVATKQQILNLVQQTLTASR